jgi:hypothetical protein
MDTIVVINESHSLMEEQENILSQFNYEFYKIPSKGLTLDEIDQMVEELSNYEYVVFVSPIPAAFSIIIDRMKDDNWEPDVFVFHNDNREKVELPNGKIIMKVASTGWVLV